MWTEPTLIEWAEKCGGQLIGFDHVIGDVSTDSRTLKSGDVYLAIKGGLFDGHNYVEAAIKGGASALVVEHEIEGVEISQLVVEDSRKALGYLAAILRDRFEGQVVALTGSAGKTSTRAMLECIFKQQPGLLATKGNFNNDIGVPKTWFRLSDKHQRILLEMGASAGGEIKWLGEFSRPHIGLLLNAGLAHTEGFGGIEGVRTAKGEIIDATLEQGGVVLNKDDPAFASWLKRAGTRSVVTFGKHGNADVSLLSYETDGFGSNFTLATPDGDISISWPVIGKHMALNAAAAAATAWLAGVSTLDIAQGLSEMTPEPGRLESIESNHGGPLIHDAYNANPDSYKAAIDVLAGIGGDTLLIAGDMAELGEETAALHREVGLYARGKIKAIWSVGEQSAHIAEAFDGHKFDTVEQLLAVLPVKLEPETVVLVKGSRSAGMERVVEALRRNN
ncbi:UDP-N-acetylmuramoyl-tripeptide--D-alanyl-D-alanine ligase [Reinekea marinisedimentorum]|uniref:UDP-N-acetylmuramoyl-tripeptide--D-alanyl-D-alanine ligase n=1 Tax=Reinekea marinisedimentorum TaxID=230495 RepID=A0A4R3I7G6_9GAMM|nr:UDP-N-acetylmuramoyl-tripeptide--D-alanyl-D-alanine ligase [Reinekea marinisedimentorum]TCS41720.1 UDP-N-acetylmuramoyl-tripeptide--D-alanyl-D-alanine ligase [Reinekea marinisedimentorum]